MFITGLGTALPAKRYTQAECWEALRDWHGFGSLAARSRAILKKVLLGNNGIATRHLALESLCDAFHFTPDTMQARFARHAPELASQAAERALQSAGLESRAIDGLIVSTCTGYLCPGLTSYVSEKLGLRPDLVALDLVGQGCGAALPNMRTAQALLISAQCKQVLSACVEVCSAAFYVDDDPGVLISACLFGDAAGAAVLSSEPSGQFRRVEWRAAGSLLNPTTRDLLRFEHRAGLLRNILTPPVPDLAAQYAGMVFRQVAARADAKRKEIAHWIFHAGGRDVLVALQRQFGLREVDMCWSAGALRDLGNVSSPFVYHALERALARKAAGGWWWMSSFGAGFSCHGALLAVQ
jgi:alkylresorcinol/alkylpyrone synthase